MLETLFIAASLQFGLPPGLLSALCHVETKHNISLIHNNDGPSPSYGVCQVKLETATWLGFKGSPKQLMQPKTNIYYAAKYLAKNMKRYDGHIEKAVIAYNQGHIGKAAHTNYSNKVFNQWSVASNGF